MLSSPLHLGHSISPHYHSNRALRCQGQDWQGEEESGQREREGGREKDVSIHVGTPIQASIMPRKGDVGWCNRTGRTGEQWGTLKNIQRHFKLTETHTGRVTWCHHGRQTFPWMHLVWSFTFWGKKKKDNLQRKIGESGRHTTVMMFPVSRTSIMAHNSSDYQ